LRKNKSAVAMIEVDQAVDCFNDITFFRRTEAGNFETPWLFFPVEDFNAHGFHFVRPKMSGKTLPMFDRTFDQLVYADSAFSSFCALNHLYITNEQNMREGAKDIYRYDIDDCINSIVAVLYTRHEDFDVNAIEMKLPFIKKKLSSDERALILHTYANVRAFLLERCPHLFPKKESEENLPPQSTGEMWLNLRYDLAETEAFKGFHTARNAMIYDVLDYLDKKAREVQHQKLKEP
jgi:hypothetical protein